MLRSILVFLAAASANAFAPSAYFSAPARAPSVQPIASPLAALGGHIPAPSSMLTTSRLLAVATIGTTPGTPLMLAMQHRARARAGDFANLLKMGWREDKTFVLKAGGEGGGSPASSEELQKANGARLHDWGGIRMVNSGAASWHARTCKVCGVAQRYGSTYGSNKHKRFAPLDDDKKDCPGPKEDQESP